MGDHRVVVHLIGALLSALCLYGCSEPQSQFEQVPQQQQPASTTPQPVEPAQPQPTTWDERSDCYPGAPPNSLADALDVLKAHCDRKKAFGVLALLAVAAVVPEALAGDGAAAGAVASDAASAGAAVDAARAEGTLAAEESAVGRVSYSARATADGEHEVRVIGENGEAQSEPYQVTTGRDGSRKVRNASGENLGHYDVNQAQSDFVVSSSDGTVRQTRGYQADGTTRSPTSENWIYIPK